MSSLYPSFLKLLLDGGVNLLTVDIRAQLIDSAAEPYLVTDSNLSQIAAAGRVGAAVTVPTAGRTTTSATDTTGGRSVGGAFDAPDITFPSIAAGQPTVEAVILYIFNATEASAQLIGYFDGLTFTPNGGGANLVWPAIGVFTI